MRRRNVVAAFAVMLEAYGAFSYFGRTWGSTRAEREKALPPDELIPYPVFRTDHAITIDAPPHDVWPWLVQMGWGRAGWYTYRWVDKLLFPANGPSAERILRQYQSLAVGDVVPDGPPETRCQYVVEMLEPEALLVLRSHTHLPPKLRNAWMDWTWTYSLTPLPNDNTRLHVRVRGRVGPWWLALVYRAAIGADFVMGRSHLRGIKRRVEHRKQELAETVAALTAA
jgi:hypothetical protein